MYYIRLGGEAVELHIIPSLILAAAVSLDGLGAGFAYGVRGLKVPILSLLIVSISSSLALLAAMVLGRSMASFFSVEISSFIGGFILILVGGYIVRESFVEAKSKVHTKDNKEDSGASLNKGIFGLVREPEKADFDRSGSINSKEAAVLGIALALDAFGAGFGAAMTGYSPLVTSLFVGMCKLIFVQSGFCLGKIYSDSLSSYKASWLAGGVLIILGILNFF